MVFFNNIFLSYWYLFFHYFLVILNFNLFNKYLTCDLPTEVVDPKLGDKKQGSFFTQYYIIVENGTKYITSEHLYDKARIGDFVIVKNDQTVDVE